MPRRPIVTAVMLAGVLLLAAPQDTTAFEFFHARGHRRAATPATAVAGRQHMARWYPQYLTIPPRENPGGGVPTYAYGYFGARGHSFYGCHRGYYGDLYQWSPLH